MLASSVAFFFYQFLSLRCAETGIESCMMKAVRVTLFDEGLGHRSLMVATGKHLPCRKDFSITRNYHISTGKYR